MQNILLHSAKEKLGHHKSQFLSFLKAAVRYYLHMNHHKILKHHSNLVYPELLTRFNFRSIANRAINPYKQIKNCYKSATTQLLFARGRGRDAPAQPPWVHNSWWLCIPQRKNFEEPLFDLPAFLHKAASEAGNRNFYPTSTLKGTNLLNAVKKQQLLHAPRPYLALNR